LVIHSFHFPSTKHYSGFFSHHYVVRGEVLTPISLKALLTLINYITSSNLVSLLSTLHNLSANADVLGQFLVSKLSASITSDQEAVSPPKILDLSMFAP